MQIKEIIKERVIQDKKKIYVADDGTEFDYQRDCERYEAGAKEAKLREKIKPLLMPEQEGLLPLTDYDEWRDVDCCWYKVNSDEEYNLVADLYGVLEIEWYGRKPDSYPAIICTVETDDYVDCYNIKTIIERTKEFFGCFNMDVEIKERKA